MNDGMGGPSEKPAPPITRRRWLIVAFVLVVVSITSWWCWPRGDARFVGKWRYTSASLNGVLTLHANGSGRFELSGGFRSWFSWQVRDDRLISGRDFHVSRAVAVWVRQHRATLTGTHLAIDEQEREVVDVTHERILLRSGPETITLDRIPE